MEYGERSSLLLAVAGLFAMLAGFASLAGGAFFTALSYCAAALAAGSVLIAIRRLHGDWKARVSPPSSLAAESESLTASGEAFDGARVAAEPLTPPTNDPTPADYPRQVVHVPRGEVIAAEATEARLRECLKRFEMAGDPWAQANVHNLFGFLYERRSDLPAAEREHLLALDLFKAAKDARGEGDSLNNLGVVCARLGDHERALDYHKRALRLRIKDHPIRQANSYNNLGVLHASSDRAKARSLFERALELSRAAGDTRGSGKGLNNLAVCQVMDDSLEAAIAGLKDALELRKRSGDWRGEAKTINNLGMVQALRGAQPAQARERFEQSALLAAKVGDTCSLRNAIHNAALVGRPQTSEAIVVPVVEGVVTLSGSAGEQVVARQGARAPGERADAGLLPDGEAVAVTTGSGSYGNSFLTGILSSGSMTPEGSLDVLSRRLAST